MEVNKSAEREQHLAQNNANQPMIVLSQLKDIWYYENQICDSILASVKHTLK